MVLPIYSFCYIIDVLIRTNSIRSYWIQIAPARLTILATLKEETFKKESFSISWFAAKLPKVLQNCKSLFSLKNEF